MPVAELRAGLSVLCCVFWFSLMLVFLTCVCGLSCVCVYVDMYMGVIRVCLRLHMCMNNFVKDEVTFWDGIVFASECCLATAIWLTVT